ncbi:sialic acid-binding Ig-like lectin 15 [Salminus brasiliensis]|uniref:sialic acid-binding Ig-like lectin 15 n=1 Tax=Salminus brasiliensis TaxID=930266 RepID=UPI003B839B8D
MVLFQTIFFFSFCSSGLMAADKWSITVPEAVNLNVGQDAIIPCSFTTPYENYQGDIKVIWRIRYPFKGPIIFQCLSKNKPSESGQNCTESIGRYSLSGNPRSNNIPLRISSVSFLDDKQYFCRVEMSTKGDNYETDTGTRLNIQVPQSLESIYIRTLPSGEQFVTCEVKGTPPPTVTWINPEITSASLVSVQSDWARASSSIPANLTNIDYTCQIHGENGLQRLSIYYQAGKKQEQQIPFTLSIVFVVLSGIFFIISVTLAVIYRKGSSEPLATSQEMKFRKSRSFERDEEIYANV